MERSGSRSADVFQTSCTRRSSDDVDPPRPTRLIACKVFRRAIEHLAIGERLPQVTVDYVDSNLHLRPVQLRMELMRRLTEAQAAEGHLVCLFGNCAPDIDELCRSRCALRPDYTHCYELFLGRRRFAELIDETAGTFFLEQDLIRNFEACCVKPLELHDPWLRKAYFKHYKRLLYIRQPNDSDLERELAALTELLELPLEVCDAEYSELEEQLLTLLEAGRR